MEERIKKIEQFIESLKNPNTIPKDIIDAWVNSGFLKFDRSISYDAGAGGNHFEEIFVKYLNKSKMISVSDLPFTYVVVSTTANTLSLINSNLNFADITTPYVILYTTDTFPGGLDLAVQLLVINATATTFQLSADGGATAIDITSLGAGTQYISLV